ncbi:hypothetical protein [Pseudomonas putida]|uniref:hypothetical protein n=1 Tax=Pseudomonas TaxID=286 RepID=UPI000AD557ED|nr:hypothetical protein [Pseudomonas putida]
MGNDNRFLFESELLKTLKLVAAKFDGAAASKNKLKFMYNKKNVAELFFEHLSRVDSYVLGGMVYGGEIFECSSKFTPPYRSNLFNESCFSFISSGMQDKTFSGNLGGAIKTPAPNAVGEVCAHIQTVLEGFYIPRILACIFPTNRTIMNVLSSPDDYAFPAVFIHCAAKLSQGEKSLDLSEALKSKKIVKNKDYDIPLLTSFI